MYDFVVVGAGMFGASFARLATDKGHKVLVIEKRNHIAGNCYTEKRNEIIFHKYGPHVFHTNSDNIWKFINKFANFEQYSVRTKALSNGKIFSLPINLMTLYQLWGISSPDEAKKKLESVIIPSSDLSNIENWSLANYGPELYEKFIYGYTVKQWGREPKDLPSNIVRRLPFRLTFDDNYFTDKYQGIPIGGFTPLFEKMLDGIEVQTNCDYFSDRSALNKMGRIVFSGRIDEFFDYRLGQLEFRSCKFDTDLLNGDYQGNAVINYVDKSVPYTRIVEHKHFYRTQYNHTLITREYPFECTKYDNPLYPINDIKNLNIYNKYSSIDTDAIIAGRCGSYRYLDMCEAIAQAIKLTNEL